MIIINIDSINIQITLEKYLLLFCIIDIYHLNKNIIINYKKFYNI